MTPRTRGTLLLGCLGLAFLFAPPLGARRPAADAAPTAVAAEAARRTVRVALGSLAPTMTPAAAVLGPALELLPARPAARER